jgi:predicted HicB family RNase H-like nuclease
MIIQPRVKKMQVGTTMGKNNDTVDAIMNELIQYKGYIGSVEFSEEDGLFYGKLQGIRSLVSYEGANAKDLVADFHEAVDTYLQSCEEDEI